MKSLFFSIILAISQVIWSVGIQNLDVQKELYPFDTGEEEFVSISCWMIIDVLNVKALICLVLTPQLLEI